MRMRMKKKESLTQINQSKNRHNTSEIAHPTLILFVILYRPGLSGYLYFVMEVMPDLKRKHVDLNQTEIMKIVDQKWATLEAKKKQVTSQSHLLLFKNILSRAFQTYLDTAAVKKAEYKKALEKYKAGTSSSTNLFAANPYSISSQKTLSYHKQNMSSSIPFPSSSTADSRFYTKEKEEDNCYISNFESSEDENEDEEKRIIDPNQPK